MKTLFTRINESKLSQRDIQEILFIIFRYKRYCQDCYNKTDILELCDKDKSKYLEL